MVLPCQETASETATCYSRYFAVSLFYPTLLMKSLQLIFLLLLFCIQKTGYNQVYKADLDPLHTQKIFDSHAQQIKAKSDSLLNTKIVDSLKRLIAGSPDDTLKVKRLIAVSHLQYALINPTTGFAIEALSLAEKIHFKQGIVSAYYAIGSIFEFRKDAKTALKYYQQALELSETANDSSNNAWIYATLLNVYFYLGDYPKAMETISREMAVAEKNNAKQRIAHCNNILGYIYFKQENFIEAEKYYDLYINNAKELKDSVLLAHALGELADVYLQEKKYTQSYKVLLTTIQICDFLLAHPGFQNASQIDAWVMQYKIKALYRLGKTFKLTGELSKALNYSLEAITLASTNSTTKYDIANYYINAGDVYKELKEFGKALRYLGYGLILARDIQHRENTMDAVNYLYQTYALQNRYDSAFYFYQLFTSLKDSIVNNETKMKVAGIQGQYDVAKKDKEISRQQQIRNILIGSFACLLIVLLLLYNGYRLQEKNKYQQEHYRQQNELFNAIVTTQDQERKRIAQDIHDSLGSLLSAAKLKLSSLEESKQLLSPDQLEKYQDSLSLLDEASSELRNISHNIMPATLSKLGIVAALQNLIDKISSHAGLQISFTAHAFERRIEETTEISIYRIILELINNIVKHAMADKVTIQLIKYPEYINLVIEDNGRGFNYEKAVEGKKGIGLGNILSRVEYLKGTIEIDSSQGEGTTVIIEIPYKSG